MGNLEEQAIHLRRTVANQLGPVFLVGLLSLWLVGTSKSEEFKFTAPLWWPWVLFAVLFLAWYIIWGRKSLIGVLRWLLPIIILILIAVYYVVSGINMPNWFFILLATIFILWSLFLIVLMVLLSIKGSRKLADNKCINMAVQSISRPISLTALLTAIIFGVIRLITQGTSDRLINCLLILGMLVWLAVAIDFAINPADR